MEKKDFNELSERKRARKRGSDFFTLSQAFSVSLSSLFNFHFFTLKILSRFLLLRGPTLESFLASSSFIFCRFCGREAATQ